jgi:hypothetical protein
LAVEATETGRYPFRVLRSILAKFGEMGPKPLLPVRPPTPRSAILAAPSQQLQVTPSIFDPQ